MRPRAEVRNRLAAIFGEALAAVQGERLVAEAIAGSLRHPVLAGREVAPEAGLLLLAVGKAAAPMAAAFEERLGPRLRAGLVVTREGHGQPLRHCRLLEAAHPVPDERCERAAHEAIALVEGAGPGDVLCVLLSGGASSLLACPAEGLSLEDLAVATRVLLDAGADIEETNAVRKHLSAVSGGRLAARCRAGRIEVLAISDVAGDRLDVIGSGPFTADPSRYGDGLAALRRRGALDAVPQRVRAHLEAGAHGQREETPKPGDPALARVRAHVLASNRTALSAAREAAVRRRLPVKLVAWPLAGEAREAAGRLVALVRRPGLEGPLLLLAGGETTVTVRGPGRGGRSQELALAAALELERGPAATLLAAGTDGSDGPTDAAGAFADEGTVARGRARGVEARAALRANDSHGFFSAEGGLFRTGPTGTNVNDLVLLHLEARA